MARTVQCAARGGPSDRKAEQGGAWWAGVWWGGVGRGELPQIITDVQPERSTLRYLPFAAIPHPHPGRLAAALAAGRRAWQRSMPPNLTVTPRRADRTAVERWSVLSVLSLSHTRRGCMVQPGRAGNPPKTGATALPASQAASQATGPRKCVNLRLVRSVPFRSVVRFVRRSCSFRRSFQAAISQSRTAPRLQVG